MYGKGNTCSMHVHVYLLYMHCKLYIDDNHLHVEHPQLILLYPVQNRQSLCDKFHLCIQVQCF